MRDSTSNSVLKQSIWSPVNMEIALKKFVKSIIRYKPPIYRKPLSNLDEATIAVFTQTKNEKVFLPIWIDHYSQYFKKSDLYVLDHQSNDGSTDNIPVNRIEIKNPLVEDNIWRMATLEAFQRFLLCSYDCVIYTDVDELIYNPRIPLNHYLQTFIRDPKHDFITARGYELYQTGDEKPLDSGDHIIEHRSKWYRNSKHYDKTLISKIPLHWTWGFHRLKDPKNKTNYAYEVYLLHLHRMDLEIMIDRHLERTKKHIWKGDGGGGHFQSSREGVIDLYNRINSPLEVIPYEHKKALKHLHISDTKSPHSNKLSGNFHD